MGYVAGIIDHEAVAVITGQKSPAFCVPADMDLGKLVLQLNKMLETNKPTTGTGSHWLALALAHLFPPTDGACPAVTTVDGVDEKQQ